MAAYDAYEAYVEAKEGGDSSSVAAAKAVGAVALSANPGGKVVKALYKSAKWVKKAVSVKEKTAKVRSKVLGRGGKTSKTQHSQNALEKKSSRPNHIASSSKNHPNVGVEYGRRPKGHVRTHQELVQDIATRAERKIGGIGPVAGTKKHTYAKKVTEGYNKMFKKDGIQVERNWRNGKELKKGDPTKGSTRLDVDVVNANPRVVYDYKFVKKPGQGLKPQQVRKIQQHGPKGASIKEINPLKPNSKK